MSHQLAAKRGSQDRSLLSNLQSAWLLLQFCAARRANCLLRVVPPHVLMPMPLTTMQLSPTAPPASEVGDTPFPAHKLQAAQLALRYGVFGLGDGALQPTGMQYIGPLLSLTSRRGLKPSAMSRATMCSLRRLRMLLPGATPPRAANGAGHCTGLLKGRRLHCPQGASRRTAFRCGMAHHLPSMPLSQRPAELGDRQRNPAQASRHLP